MKIPIYQSGYSKIAVIDIDNHENSYTFNESDLNYLSREIYLKSADNANVCNKIALILSNYENNFIIQFVQYIPEIDKIDLKGNCGNAIVAVATHLIDSGLQLDVINILSVNTNISSKIQIIGKHNNTVSTSIEFINPTGAVKKCLLPCQCVRQEIDGIRISVIDAGNPYVWIISDDISSNDIMKWNDSEYNHIMKIRKYVQNILGIESTSVFPKVACIAPSNSNEYDLAARMISVPSWHPSFALTGIVCLCVGALCRGSTINEVMNFRILKSNSAIFRILTPSGYITANIIQGEDYVSSVTIEQSSRKIGELLL